VGRLRYAMLQALIEVKHERTFVKYCFNKQKMRGQNLTKAEILAFHSDAVRCRTCSSTKLSTGFVDNHGG
jgi:hypothetical protein